MLITDATTGKNYIIVDSPKKVQWLFETLAKQQLVSFDIESSHHTSKPMVGQRDVKVAGVSFSWAKDSAAYLPLYTGHGEETHWRRAEVFEPIVARLKAFLEGPCEKAMQNGKFDCIWCWRCLGIKVRNFTFDTMLAHHLLNEEATDTGGRHGLKPMATHYLDPNATRYEEDLKKALNYYDPEAKRYSEIPIDIVGTYACSDADYTLQLMRLFEPRLEAEGLADLFYDVVMPLQNTCLLSEIGGLAVDRDKIDELDIKYRAKMAELVPSIYSLSGYTFDLGSPKQIVDVLYGKLGLPKQYGKKGQLTTDSDALDAIKDLHPCVAPLAEYRSIAKLHSSYVLAIQSRIDPATTRLHPTFLIHGTVTGRMASEEPNCQNLPRKENGGLDIKAIFVAGEGHKIILSDFSQIELRIAAHCSKEPAWIDAFLRGDDLHSATAKKCFNLDCDVKDVKKLYDDKRSGAKCFHPDTEVLTRSGWKRIMALAVGEEVLQAYPRLGGSVRLSWVVPTEVFTQKHPSGQLVHLKNEGIDLRVTPDHRMLAWSGKQALHRVVMPSDFNKVRLWANAGKLDEGENSLASEVWLRLAVSAQADGSYTEDGAIRWGFTKRRKIERLRALLDASGATYTVSIGKNGSNPDVTWFYLSNVAGGGVIQGMLDDKRLPWSWLALSFKERSIIVEELQYWDSCKMPNWRMFRYSSSIEQNIDVAQALATSVGRKTRKVLTASTDYESLKSDSWSLTIRDKATTRGENVQTEVFPYDGEVACLSVPSTFVLVRDGGIPVITGQSVNFGILYGMSEYRLADVLKMSVEEAKAFIDVYFEGLPVLKSWIDGVHEQARQTGFVTNILGRRRRLPDAMLQIPKSPMQRPANPPACYRKGAPNVVKEYYSGAADLNTQEGMQLFYNTALLQERARLIGETKCSTCPVIGNCTLEREISNMRSRVSSALRQSVNSLVQSAASDLAAMSYTKVLRVCGQNGIPISIDSSNRGIRPWNIIHDELCYVVADEYVDAVKRIVRDTMIGIYPSLLVPLDVDLEVVDRWSDKYTH